MELGFSIIGIALVQGLAGSIHCAGMCGPFAGTLSLYAGKSSQSKVTFLQLSYNLGRFASYSLVGVLLGFFGKGTNLAFSQLSWIQEGAAWISVAFILFLGFSLIFWGKSPESVKFFSKWIGKLGRPLLEKIRENQGKTNRVYSLAFTFGILTALLPCGVLYPAYALSFATGSPVLGALTMSFFFLGTFPLLFGIGFGFHRIASAIGNKSIKLVGLAIVIIGLGTVLVRFSHTHTDTHDHSGSHSHSYSEEVGAPNRSNTEQTKEELSNEEKSTSHHNHHH
ncbi:hypothetical protein CH373_05115 [Leptospira perolatii]|uniref:Urease accessory protein UreH-like transmembrane domain-containing protein n=1 Tax=Leptospira perolatii TaxID=2023191 RepID=A0A2M9ZQC9_9LEPT|nr:sulfite exporter TauE/SafE family protein [Leptospira perolatii]PJZ70454.1 hypothetical protein CH360_05535 [Leptospira perolatii]PJZ74290.1 hypothetical protein CH373_05115 [Leptospira perolatii]